MEQLELFEKEILQQDANSRQVDGTHYKQMAIQPWDVMESVLTREEWIGFLKGNILKYSLRDGKKAGALHDAAKALHYKQKLAEVLNAQ